MISWPLLVPKSVSILRRGYSWALLRDDAVAGLTVAIVALPLAMALAIASGTTPDKGLITAIVAGFLISALGGSRFQIGGPTGAFVVVVFNVIATHGYDGLILATLMAGVILVAAGLSGIGAWVKYIPQPVVTGFTAGIAVIIFSSQVVAFLGLRVEEVPADFLGKWAVIVAEIGTVNAVATALALLALGFLVVQKRLLPKVPGMLVVVVLGAGAVAVWGLPVETIGSAFGGIPLAVPEISLPTVTPERLWTLLPSALTIAFLAGVESLLSAVVADGMTGTRHRSNCELVAQGVANCGSALIGGLPATGAVARTATNVKAGARTPVAGMAHAVFLLLAMVLLAPLAVHVPLAVLAAVLVMVAWNMSEVERFHHLMRAPLADRVILLLTFALTVLVDLTVAIEVGVLLAAVVFVHRMAQAVEAETHVPLLQGDAPDSGQDAYVPSEDLKAGIVSFQIAGPFFFGVANLLTDVLERIGRRPKVFILRMRQVPLIDATGAGALQEFIDGCEESGTVVILSGVQPGPRRVLEALGLGPRHHLHYADDFPTALTLARRLLPG